MKHITPRQVHLDFHTSELIPDIGSRFSRENFQTALKKGSLSSITVFAKCHHGYCYYDTHIGTRHPNLKVNLLDEMLDAAHEIGVRAPIYITAGWSALDASAHREWLMKDKEGNYIPKSNFSGADPDSARPECSWDYLCLNNDDYTAQIYALTREICDRYETVDGLFYDICFLGEACYCDSCKKGMADLGLDPEKEEDAKQYYILKHQEFMRKCGEILREKHPDATVFFNSGGADPYRPQYHALSTHFEMEDLPTTWGGYDTMPPTAKYFEKTGKDYMGMTGKFHTAWGEFGGYKIKEALRYECAAMMSYGARCSVGDQMHPDGEMDYQAYENIGYAYSYVKRIEEYCLGGESATRLGVWLTGDEAADKGVIKMLLETQNDFDIVSENRFDPFDVVILPDCAVLGPEAIASFRQYLDEGGRALITGKSLLAGGSFQIDFGVRYDGEYDTDIDYIVAGSELLKGVGTSPLLAYYPAGKVEAKEGEVLATTLLPYFKRTYAKYCGHKNTPYNKADGGHPAVIRNGNIIYMAHPICRIYKEYGSVYHRNLFINALNLLNTAPMLTVDLMSAGRVTLRKQKESRRYVLNLLYASDVIRGKVDVLEDFPTLRDIGVVLRIPEPVKRVWLPVKGEELEYEQTGDTTCFQVPSLTMHELVVVEY